MKKILTLTFLTFFFFSLQYEVAAVVGVQSTSNEKSEIESDMDADKIKSSWMNLSKKERRLKKKELRKKVKQLRKSAASDQTILLAIIAIFIPFLAVGLYDGITKRFWISLLLTLLLFLPGLIYALVVILGDK